MPGLQLDIPCDVQGRDHEGHLWAFLDEAARPDVVFAGAVVITGDDETPVVARVLRVEDRPGGRMVVMDVVGTAAEIERTLIRARIESA
ncbi:MAG: hypothetical protein ACRD0C_00755 [Acidimicrobiia bacterium]